MDAASIVETAAKDFGIAPLAADDLVDYDPAIARVEIVGPLYVDLQTASGTERCLAHTGDTVADLLSAEADAGRK